MTTAPPSRRSLLTRLGLAASAAALWPRAAAAQARTAFQPARHPQDAWLDGIPGRHRSFIDAATVNGAGESLLYANNLYVANGTGYQLAPRDVAVVVCLRHFATAFAFNDAMWAKYGAALSTLLPFMDPKTKQPPTTNLLNSSDYGMAMPNFGNTIGSVAARGTHFAVCGVATGFFAQQLAMRGGAGADAITAELTANLIPNSHMVSAGVVAVNRAQEYGYTLLTTL